MKVRDGYLLFVTVDFSTVNMPVAGLHRVGTKISTYSVLILNSLETRYGVDCKKKRTLTEDLTASARTSGGAFHVPNPTDGILAPVFRSKYRGPCIFSFSIFFCYTHITLKILWNKVSKMDLFLLEWTFLEAINWIRFTRGVETRSLVVSYAQITGRKVNFVMHWVNGWMDDLIPRSSRQENWISTWWQIWKCFDIFLFWKRIPV